MARVKIRRTHREELPGLVVLRDAASKDATVGDPAVLDLDMGADPELDHLVSHDPDGFLSAVEKDETLGFASAHIRSRQCIISQLWVLEQHRGKGAGQALLGGVLNFGIRSGAKEYLSLAPLEGPIQGLLITHGFSLESLVYLFRLEPEKAAELGRALAQLFPGLDATSEVLNRQGQADIDRIDKGSRNITREVDHHFWLKKKLSRISFVRQGQRIAAYGLGGPQQIGPVAGSTPDAALAALGRAILSAVEAAPGKHFDLHVPAAFSLATEALLEQSVPIVGNYGIFGRNLNSRLDRIIFGLPALP